MGISKYYITIIGLKSGIFIIGKSWKSAKGAKVVEVGYEFGEGKRGGRLR